MERATIFLKSFSLEASKEENLIEMTEKIIKIEAEEPSFNFSALFFITKRPAVTSVEEWTKEEMGVGADIAAGSQLEKGNVALLVKMMKTKNSKKIKRFFFTEAYSIKLKKNKNKISPKRLVKKVKPELLKLSQFL